MESEKGKDLLIVLIIILVGICSFELGRLSKESSQGGLQIEFLDPGHNAVDNQEGSVFRALELAPRASQSPLEAGNTGGGKGYFASSRGTKYYSVGCSAGKTIKQENRVYFNTPEDAEDAGYELSSSCR